jgi:hypothetical protein
MPSLVILFWMEAIISSRCGVYHSCTLREFLAGNDITARAGKAAQAIIL